MIIKNRIIYPLCVTRPQHNKDREPQMIRTNPRCILVSLLAIMSFVCVHTVQADTALNGVAIYTELGQEQYIAGLYTSKLSSVQREVLTSNEEKELQVRILANSISSRAFKKMWIEGLAINASSRELETHSQNMATFSNMLKIRLLRGDIFTMQRSMNDVTIILNGSTVGRINDPKFFDMLIRAWIGTVPLSTEFRQALLSGGEMEPNLVSRFQTTQPSASRIAAISAGLEAIGISSANTTTLAVKDKPTPVPKKATPTPKKATPTPKKAKPAPKVVKVEPPQLLLGPTDGALLDSSIFDVTEEDVEYTAESLLTQQLYIAKLKKWSQRFLKYPVMAQKRGQQGNVRLSVTVDDDGKVLSTEILEAARHAVLTEAAVTAVESASPFPRIPPSLRIQGDTFVFSLPVTFVLVND